MWSQNQTFKEWDKCPLQLELGACIYIYVIIAFLRVASLQAASSSVEKHITRHYKIVLQVSAWFNRRTWKLSGHRLLFLTMYTSTLAGLWPDFLLSVFQRSGSHLALPHTSPHTPSHIYSLTHSPPTLPPTPPHSPRGVVTYWIRMCLCPWSHFFLDRHLKPQKLGSRSAIWQVPTTLMIRLSFTVRGHEPMKHGNNVPLVLMSYSTVY